MEYYKITNEKENHYGFQYKNGLNILIEEFNSSSFNSCCKGGFYFTDINNILKFVDYGCYLREVFLPTNDPNFRMIKDPSNDKWRANKIILGWRYNLWNVETFRLLRKKGMDTNKFVPILYLACNKGYYEIVKFIIKENSEENSKENYKENYKEC